MAAAFERDHQARPFTGALASDAERVVGEMAPLLRYIAQSGPAALAQEARRRIDDEPSTARCRLLVYWADDANAEEAYLSRAVLRPYVEVLSTLRINPDRVHRPGRCPFCGGRAWISARRSESSMDGARRLLGCALCGGEWQLNRGYCPCCLEEDPHRLPNFQGDAYPSVRIEGCETCHRYLKSIDQTMDARSIPEVDDLMSLSVDLWAVDAGFIRLEPGLAGF
jgi:hypothetical protein